MNVRGFIFVVLITAFLVSSAACNQVALSGSGTLNPNPVDGGLLHTSTPTQGSGVGVVDATSTQQPIASITSTASQTFTQTATPTFTPTPTLHPMQIPAQRLTPYPGSPIVIEEQLQPGANYNRYIASYLSEGLKIYALLTIPNGEMPASGWPVIVFNHGYIPPQQYRTTERYLAYVDLLARSGYIIFRSDYRGHGNSEGVATGAYGHPGYTSDVLNAVGAMKGFPQADPDRIGMWGHSMGGYLTLRSMVVSPDIKSGVIWAGVVASYPDMLSRWRMVSGASPTPNPDGPRRWRIAWIEDYGTIEQNPEFWYSISANSYLFELSGPVQLHHGTNDSSVPLEFSEILYQQIQEAGKYVELYVYEGDDHNLSNYFNLAMNRTIEFFDEYLK